MICAKCETEISDEVNYCPNCGKRQKKGPKRNLLSFIKRGDSKDSEKQVKDADESEAGDENEVQASSESIAKRLRNTVVKGKDAASKGWGAASQGVSKGREVAGKGLITAGKGLGTLGCKTGLLHDKKWDYVAEGECKTIAICQRCGQTVGEKIEHQLNTPTLLVGKCAKIQTCARCQYTTPPKKVAHNWSLPHYVSEGSCRRQQTCRHCGEQQPSETQHQFGQWHYTSQQSCRQVQTCRRCGAEQTGKVVHDYGEWQKVDGDPCQEIRICLNCGTQEKKQLEHEWSAPFYKNLSINCEEFKRCNRCGIEESVGIRHRWTSWENISNTCSQYRKCTECNEKEIKDTPHQWEKSWHYEKPGSCLKVQQCERCREVQREDPEDLKHENWIWRKATNECYEYEVCERCGEESGEKQAIPHDWVMGEQYLRPKSCVKQKRCRVCQVVEEDTDHENTVTIKWFENEAVECEQCTRCKDLVFDTASLWVRAKVTKIETLKPGQIQYQFRTLKTKKNLSFVTTPKNINVKDEVNLSVSYQGSKRYEVERIL